MSIWTPVINNMLVGMPAQYSGSIYSSCAQGIRTSLLCFYFYQIYSYIYMLCCSALKTYLTCLRIRIVVRLLFMCKFNLQKQLIICSRRFLARLQLLYQSVITNGNKVDLLSVLCVEYYVTVYQLFTVKFHKCIIIAINVFYILPIMLTLCLMLSLTHYAQNYAGIEDGSLTRNTVKSAQNV